MKKIKYIIFLLSVTIFVNMFPVSSYAKNKDYIDLQNHWSYSMVKNLESYGIVNGYSDGTFRPEDVISCEGFIKMVILSLGYDVKPSDDYWANSYIQKALEKGIIETGDFVDYKAPITRCQMAKIIAKSLKYTPSKNTQELKAEIYDYATIQNEYKEYVLIAYGEKIMTGYENNDFQPNKLSSRAEAVTTITRLIDKNGGIKVEVDSNKDDSNSQIATASTAELYVAPNGDDKNNGSKDAPFKTLESAKANVRAIIESGKLPKGGISVYLREGTYYMYEGLEFDAKDSGTKESPIVYTSYPNEKVTLCGNVPIKPEWFTPIDEKSAKTVIDANSVKNILMVDLKAHNITDYGEMSTRGYHYFNKGRYAQGELIVNGENQTLARYPNKGTISVPKENVDTENLAFTYTDERVSKWKNATQAYMVGTVSINYENNAYPIDKIDTSNKKLYIKEGKINTYYTNGWFFGENMLEEIDSVGEYYIDRENGKLYYFAPSDFKTASYNVGLTTLKTPLFNFNGTKNVKVTNLSMEGGRGYAVLGTSEGYKIPTFTQFLESQKINIKTSKMFDRSTKYATYIKDPESYTDAQLFPGHVWDGFLDDGKGVDGIEIKNCNIFNFGGGGIIIRGDNVKIENNHIKNMGGVGLYLRGGDLETLTPSGDTILNNKVHRVGYLQRAYFPAIAMHGVAIHVAYNDIYDAPHCIFNYHGNDHIIEYNKIHEAVKECLDMDAIYTRNEYMPQWRGNILRNNYIYDFGNYPVGEYTKQLNVSGIRTDNYGHGLQIYNNIFANIGSEGANNVIGVTAQGNRNLLKGNMFIDCSSTFWGWGTYSAGKTWNMEDPLEKERVELAEKYASIDIFNKKYPELSTFKNEYYKSVPTNVFDENLVVNIKFKLSTVNGTINPQSTRGATELILGTNNIVTTKDPGFSDYNKQDYTLKADSEAISKIPNLKNIDMTKIGNNGIVGPK